MTRVSRLTYQNAPDGVYTFPLPRLPGETRPALPGVSIIAGRDLVVGDKARGSLADEERESLQRRLAVHRRNLWELQKRVAMYGPLEAPLHLLNEIAAEEEALAEIERRLGKVRA